MKRNYMGIVYGVLSVMAMVTLAFSFFGEVKESTQMMLLLQTVGFAFVSGMCVFGK